MFSFRRRAICFTQIEFELRSWVKAWMKSNEMASTGDIWVQWFSCCFHQPQSPTRRRQRRHQRMRIDRSMIGNPTNFVHTGTFFPTNTTVFDYIFRFGLILYDYFMFNRTHWVKRRRTVAASHQCHSKSDAKQRWLRVELTSNSSKCQTKKIHSQFFSSNLYFLSIYRLAKVIWSLDCTHSNKRLFMRRTFFY